MTDIQFCLADLQLAEASVFRLIEALGGQEPKALLDLLPMAAPMTSGNVATIRAALLGELGIDEAEVPELGVVHTARILPRQVGRPPLVAFALMAGREPKVIWEPTPARTVAVYVENGRWKVWGAPHPADWSDAELVHLPSNFQPKRDEFLSVLGTQWIMAIEPHLAALLAIKKAAGIRGLVAPRELAHSMATISMLVFAIESIGARLASLNRLDPDIPQSIVRGLSEIEWRQELTEVITLRNVLTHNHVWRVVVSVDANWEFLQAEEFEPLVGHRDRKDYLTAVDETGSLTKRLRLHLIPTMIRRLDVAAVLPVAVRTFDHLAALDVENMRSLADHSIRMAPRTLMTLRQISSKLNVSSQ